MENDLISRSALLEEISSLTITITGLREGKGVLREVLTEYRKAILQTIDEAPAVDAETVRHGRWLDNEYYMFCSVCGVQWYYCDNETQDFKFCPNCGAKMDGDSHE